MDFLRVLVREHMAEPSLLHERLKTISLSPDQLEVLRGRLRLVEQTTQK